MNQDFTIIGQLTVLVNYLHQDAIPEIPNLADIESISSLLDLADTSSYNLDFKLKIIRNRVRQIVKESNIFVLKKNLSDIYSNSHNQQYFSKFVIGYAKERKNLLNGLILKNYRAKQDLTIVEMASMLSVNVKNIQAWEAHKRNIPENIVRKLG